MVETAAEARGFEPWARTLSRATGAGVLLVSPEGELAAVERVASGMLEAAGAVSEAWAAIRESLPGPPSALAAGGFRTDVEAGGRALGLALVPFGDEGWTVGLLRERHAAVTPEGPPADDAEDRRLASRVRAVAAVYRPFVHDLKAPLNAVVINLEILKTRLEGAVEDDATRSRLLGYLAVLRAELGRLDEGLRTLTAETGPPRDEHGRFDLCDAVREVLALVGPACRARRVDLGCALPDGPAVVEAHRDRIKLAVLHLFVHALEATPPGGAIGVSLGCEAGRARLEITDEGRDVGGAAPGREPEVAMEATGADGAGRTVARAILADAGGGIAWTRVPGGTRATATLPVARGRE